jgi:alcohol dehydrogenase YqhD (iron-dependent ADH family)
MHENIMIYEHKQQDRTNQKIKENIMQYYNRIWKYFADREQQLSQITIKKLEKYQKQLK